MAHMFRIERWPIANIFMRHTSVDLYIYICAYISFIEGSEHYFNKLLYDAVKRKENIPESAWPRRACVVSMVT